MQNLESKKKNNFPLWGKLLVGFIVINVLSLPIVFRDRSSIENKVAVSEAITAIGGALRIQSDSYRDTVRFIQSWNDLNMGVSASNDNYEFKISLIGNNVVIATASPKKDSLISLTGFVFVRRDSGSYFGWICATSEPSRTPPQVANTGNSVECLVGSYRMSSQ